MDSQAAEVNVHVSHACLYAPAYIFESLVNICMPVSLIFLCVALTSARLHDTTRLTLA